MRTDVAATISKLTVPPEGLAIFWLGQAGFVLKTSEGRIVYVDPYLTDSVERLAGFRRLMASVAAPEEVRADAVLISHHHEDHLDVDAIPVIARNSRAVFVAPAESVRRLLDMGIAASRCREIAPGREVSLGHVTVRAVFADHGDLAPDAVGFVLEYGFTRVYFTGDTAYRPERMREVASLRPEIILPVINGAYGNLGAEDAAALVRDVGATVVIPCHFWTFVEHGGDPAAFRDACRRTAPAARLVFLTQGGCWMRGG